MTETLEITIRDVIVAAQVEATAVPLREYDEVTVHGLPEVIEVPAFKGFEDFELDLSLLSPPPSPPASASGSPRSSSPQPSFSSARSDPFSSRSGSPSKEASPKRLHSRGGTAARGTWPLAGYVGRGTPIDRNRRIEWGAAGSEEVGEDGVLFSEVRSTSLDSAFRPSQRSISPEWKFLSAAPLGHRSSTLPPKRSNSRVFPSTPVVPTPEIKIEGLGAGNPEEWSSFMETILGSADSTVASTSHLEAAPPPEPSPTTTEDPEPPKETFRPAPDAPLAPPMSPEEMQQLSNGLEMDLNIGAALDLALRVKDDGTHMNYFNLDLLPKPESGRESPSSVYSSPPQSPRASSPPTPSVSDNRSMTSTKAEANVGLAVKSVSRPWWRRILGRFRRMHTLLGSH
ncbi:hypothetical protein BDZ94DRAFT_312710 [Collybia nuda]|uniref:Uncharacterized protein n=1 Tax=Collybia nuda TaxID=64659 RepID=A0A9P5XUJ9_9AGAR|nr:hypothetical protein BDZ94DRAFT_312710 [Collybia nuda]